MWMNLLRDGHTYDLGFYSSVEFTTHNDKVFMIKCLIILKNEIYIREICFIQ